MCKLKERKKLRKIKCINIFYSKIIKKIKRMMILFLFSHVTVVTNVFL